MPNLLVVALTAGRHNRVAYYAAMGTAGSVMGSFLTDIVCRKGGEKGLKEKFPGRTFQYVERKIKNNAGPALAVACLIPQPFPFTAFIIVLSALQYPRWRMLGIVTAGRSVRFSIEGVLAIFYERRILEMAKSSLLQEIIGGLIAIPIIGSAWSFTTW